MSLNASENVTDELPRSLFVNSIIQRELVVPFISIGQNIEEILSALLHGEIDGKCITEGYVKPGTIKLVSYSSGRCTSSSVVFNVSYECLLCSPVEGMIIKVKVANITKAGLRGQSRASNSPIDVFIARDHNIDHPKYNEIQIDDICSVVIIGYRYEVNDTTISIIADLTEEQMSIQLE